MLITHVCLLLVLIQYMLNVVGSRAAMKSLPSPLQYTVWNDHDKKMQGYIETKTKPVVFYLPKEHTPQTEELVAKTRDKIEGQCVAYNHVQYTEASGLYAVNRIIV